MNKLLCCIFALVVTYANGAEYVEIDAFQIIPGMKCRLISKSGYTLRLPENESDDIRGYEETGPTSTTNFYCKIMWYEGGGAFPYRIGKNSRDNTIVLNVIGAFDDSDRFIGTRTWVDNKLFGFHPHRLFQVEKIIVEENNYFRFINQEKGAVLGFDNTRPMPYLKALTNPDNFDENTLFQIKYKVQDPRRAIQQDENPDQKFPLDAMIRDFHRLIQQGIITIERAGDFIEQIPRSWIAWCLGIRGRASHSSLSSESLESIDSSLESMSAPEWLHFLFPENSSLDSESDSITFDTART